MSGAAGEAGKGGAMRPLTGGHPAGLTGATIILHPLSADRARNVARLRKRRGAMCGEYRWTVPAPGGERDGRGFYFESGRGGLAIASHGAGFDLRVADANDHLRGSRLSCINGYYADEFQDMTIRPYVVALPHGRGFLAAYGEGPGMWGSVGFSIYDTAEDAARAAHTDAEHAAEREREYREEEEERLRAEEEEAARLAEEEDAAEGVDDGHPCTLEHGVCPCARGVDGCECHAMIVSLAGEGVA